MYSKTAVIGIGNILMRDDGLGVHLIDQLSRHPGLPASVRCIDGGTAPFEAMYACGDSNRFIVADAVAAGGEPGMIYNMTVQQWRTCKSITMHDLSLPDALFMSPGAGTDGFSVQIVGMEPAEISAGLELSQAVKKKFPDFIVRVLQEVVRIDNKK
ncbi:MAG: hydrogenase maturation protease [bacterium]|nr:hydrogenase maturation protease [bacterium]